VSSAGRLAAATVLVIGVATLPIDSRARALGVAALLLLVVGLARPSPRRLVKRLLAAGLAIFAVVVPLLFAIEPIRALSIVYRSLVAAAIAIAAGSTLEIAELPRALRALGVPQLVASTIFALVWQIGAIADEARRLLLARRLRGASGIGPGVMTTLLVRTRLRADRVELALELRGATTANATSAARLNGLDALAIASTVVLVLGLHWIR
jgi:energy-coupling factor transporter transmembrane protein EcfT